jgi:hypothetical protein
MQLSRMYIFNPALHRGKKINKTNVAQGIPISIPNSIRDGREPVIHTPPQDKYYPEPQKTYPDSVKGEVPRFLPGMDVFNKLRPFQNFSFWNPILRFSGKTGLCLGVFILPGGSFKVHFIPPRE